VVDESLVDLARVEGTVDGFFTSSVSTASALMSDLEDDLEASIDDLNLVDSQEESQLISLHQALASNAVAGLAILNQQRNSIVTMIQAIAGLT